jgi:hypothetical protein
VDPKQFDDISRKLDMISRLLSLNLVKDLGSVAAKVETLSSCGFQPKEIAVLLNKEPNNIHQILHKLRSKGTQSAGESTE